MTRHLQVEILAGPDVGESFDFYQDSIRLGRGSTCELRIASPHVSRQQCELSWQGDQVVLENLGTVNHTYLNDRPIDRVYVQDGDLITFCDVALRVRMPSAAAAPSDPDRTLAYSKDAMPPGSSPIPPGGGPASPEALGSDLSGATRVAGGPQAPGAGQETTHPPSQGPVAPPGAPGGPPAPPAPAPPHWPPPPGAQPPQGGVGAATAAFPAHVVPTAAQFGPAPGAPGAPMAAPPGAPPYGQGHPGTYPPGVSMPGGPRGMPQPGGMPPGGMPGQPGAAGGLQGGAAKARRPPNIQLVRNIVLGMAGLVLLLLLSFAALSRLLPDNEPIEPATANTEAYRNRLPEVSAEGRTGDEIVRDAEDSYSKAVTFMREFQVADGNLWLAISLFKQAKAELLLVDPSLWPPFAREINPGIQKAQNLMDQAFRQAKLKQAHYRQSGDYQMAMEEMDGLTRMIPDRGDDRNQYARRQKKALRALMSGKKKDIGPF